MSRGCPVAHRDTGVRAPTLLAFRLEAGPRSSSALHLTGATPIEKNALGHEFVGICLEIAPGSIGTDLGLQHRLRFYRAEHLHVATRILIVSTRRGDDGFRSEGRALVTGVENPFELLVLPVGWTLGGHTPESRRGAFFPRAATRASVTDLVEAGAIGGKEAVIDDIGIECGSREIAVRLTSESPFNGLIYPKGLSRNSTCMASFDETRSRRSVTYVIPLWSCNTMSTTMPDGGVEYFNTIVVQPHRKLVTNQGRGYHVRCRYQTQEKTVQSDLNVSQLGTTPLTATAAMPACYMRIYFGDPGRGAVAENVRIGDPLTLEVMLDTQDIYGFLVTNCWVRDGLGQGEQPLIDEFGCPVDPEIMGPFVYEENKRVARVNFQAHKFPYTPSVYYQCNVRLCIRSAGGCDFVPPKCPPEGDVNGLVSRTKRQARNKARVEEEDDRTIQVYSGLYVSEEEESPDDSPEIHPVDQGVFRGDKFCLSPKKFAIAIAVAGLILMLAIVFTVLLLITRRRRQRLKESSTSGSGSSSVYSGPYSNQAYSHSSS
ncbi:unnamed protein product [Darwinula stevensoni]|uniref:ZP domain-containing protein n=1 Tax=Darwinula stevensoni TaxID=69355 RepID=A0A7R8XDK4_9CRUS|nr:unnamed protein product [Darwinula stevensoni]CAG0894874.1 unnamed protein product [Darwinula stevensoni]